LAGAILQRAASLVPSLVGGDADLGGSTKTPLKDSPKVQAGQFVGRNLRFGIREHAMGALANGMTLYGSFIPFTATFLTFSDYMRPPIRLAALSEIQAIHVFTHDSIFLGEDGPTHQSVEHVAALRLIPNVDVWRPANAVECAAAWAGALLRKNGPSEIILSRQKVDDPPSPVSGKDAANGGYIALKETGGAPEIVIVATGSEVGVAVTAAKTLSDEGRRVRVVSMPCVEVFARQTDAYRESVLPKNARRVSIEAGRTDGWWKWIGSDGLAIGVDTFGASAPASVLAEKYGLTAPQIATKIRAWFKA
jgi:transketolase